MFLVNESGHPLDERHQPLEAEYWRNDIGHWRARLYRSTEAQSGKTYRKFAVIATEGMLEQFGRFIRNRRQTSSNRIAGTGSRAYQREWLGREAGMR